MSNAFETALLEHYFNNTDHANVGDAAGLQNSTAAGSFHVSLHTAYPGEAGSQNTSECAYGSYARQAVARSGAGWTGTRRRTPGAIDPGGCGPLVSGRTSRWGLTACKLERCPSRGTAPRVFRMPRDRKLSQDRSRPALRR